MIDSAASGNGHITTADLNWNNNTPVSRQFDDVYFSKDDGLAESRYVFIEHNRLAQRWAALEDQPFTHFTLLETGFGTGLNFLATLDAWIKSGLQNAQLHYLSLEKFPLTPKDLRLALNHWPSLAHLSDRLIACYPPLVPGTHRIEMPEYRLTLTLIFADATDTFNDLCKHSHLRVDAWLLDGFAPSKNPDMWQAPLFNAMHQLSSTGSTVATFTAAGAVRRGLIDAGFTVHKVAGFGRKREMLTGHYSNPPTNSAEPITQMPTAKPWFCSASAINQRQAQPRTALVIGAGLAGSACAHALAEAGLQVQVSEQRAKIAQEASGNPTGITFTKMSVTDSPQNRFYQRAYLLACTRIQRVLDASSLTTASDYQFNGVVQLGFNAEHRAQHEQVAESGLWPEQIVQRCDRETTTELIGCPSTYPSLLLKQGGWLKPAKLCAAYLDHPNITVSTGQTINNLHFDTAHRHWQVDANTCYDIVVIANSFGAAQFLDLDSTPLRSVRGQLTYLDEKTNTTLLRAINYDGYITPACNGQFSVGATFQPKALHRTLEINDQQQNLQKFCTALPEFSHQLDIDPHHSTLRAGRVGFRCQTPDYLPLIGSVPIRSAFIKDYEPIGRGFLKQPLPVGQFYPGLYLSVGHGSRGITSSALAASIITSHVTQTPSPIDHAVLEAVHPARFLIRDIKRGRYRT